MKTDGHICGYCQSLLDRAEPARLTIQEVQEIEACESRFKLDTHFTANWTAVPEQTGQPFQSKLDSCSRANWTLIPRQTGH